MKHKSVVAIYLCLCLSHSSMWASEADTTKFKPNWFVQVQGGINYSFGYIGTDLVSPAAQIGVGYQFTPIWALRLAVNGWESKSNFHQYNGIYHNYKWNYIAPVLDVKINLVNAIARRTYNPKRIFGLNIIAGVGMNIGFNNKGNYIEPAHYPMQYYWDDTRVRAVARIGLDVDFRCSQRVTINLEAVANHLSDRYNSQKDPNGVDCYLTSLLGVKIDLGKQQKKKTEPVVEATPIAEVPQTETVEEVKPKSQVVINKSVIIPFQKEEKNFSYAIRETKVSAEAMEVIKNIADLMQKNPDTKVCITGYADKETGNPRVNMRYSQQRADNVAKALQECGIDVSRMTIEAKGDTVQPFAENDMNRCTICIVEASK